MTAQLKSHSQGQTLVLTISNPEHRNALGPEMYSAGVETLNVAESNPDVRSVVITGEGAHFSAGGNLNRLLSNRDLPPEHQAQSIEGLHNWIEAIRTFPKPVIAAVEGAARQGQGFRWHWPAISWWLRKTACLSWPTARWVCRPMAVAAGTWGVPCHAHWSASG
jgi:1,4-dihydroxy-2-naphthoyl-CoA synthase